MDDMSVQEYDAVVDDMAERVIDFMMKDEEIEHRARMTGHYLAQLDPNLISVSDITTRGEEDASTAAFFLGYSTFMGKVLARAAELSTGYPSVQMVALCIEHGVTPPSKPKLTLVTNNGNSTK